ncbi:MAG: type II toxin-antitoxin system RelE/ParE family toxin [Thermoguttaceae bacterium]|jgi:addiction module RelE/StbE family toxin
MPRYDVDLKPSAVADLDELRKFDAAQIADAMEECLTNEPARESRSRIKRLRGLASPDYRLRVGDYRVFYNIDDEAHRVDVLRVMHKDQTRAYYEELKP